MAVACMATLAEGGMRAPDDVAIIGFDGVPIAQYVTPALSTMALNLAELGERALEKLVAITEAEGQVEATTEMLKPELVIRASSRRHA
jgi:LacI family transcriptional regulator